MKHLNLTILALFLSIASFAQIGAITGPNTICEGSTGAMSDTTAGGSWTCSTPSVAAIGASSGIVVGLATGAATITYTIGASYVTYAITVAPVPAAIAGATSVCTGSSITESDISTGGIWSSSVSVVATMGFATGVLTGVAAGTTTVTYALSSTGCYVTTVVTVNPLPAAITGTPTLCVGGTTTLSDAGSGIWSSSSPVVASVGSVSGVVSGYSSGTANISYALATGCVTAVTVTVSPAPATYSVTGGGSYCSGGAGVTVGLSATTTGCTYQLYNSGVVMGAPIAGTGAPLDFGMETAAGTYTIVANPGTGCATTMTGSAIITISPLPSAFTVSGGGAYCAGGIGMDISLSGSAVGINYQLYVGPTPVGVAVSGTGAPVDFGFVTMAGIYSVAAADAVTGCSANMSGSATISINPLPTVYSVGGGGSYCSGGSGVDVNLSNSDLGVNYQLYNGGSAVGSPIAGSAGLLDFGSETAAGTYTVVATDATTTCTNNMTGTAVITVNPLPTVTASASAATCGGVVTLTGGGATSYSWSPTTGLSCSGCASPTLLPSASTTYSVIGTDGSGCTNTATVSVDGNRISGYISYSVTPSAGDLKVWLVQFSPSDSVIIATDSTVNCVDGGTAYYQFMDEPAGNYMVKADLLSSVPGTSGYIPTYSLSTPHWDSAATISHSSAADSLHINMVYGTVPSGPGFISGYVVSGAGRNTGGVPAVGMLVYLKDVSGHIITYNYTDTSGAYSFSSLANGSYIIYPETYKYYTTPSAVINLTAAAESATGINFKQHTSYGAITPYDDTKVPQIASSGNGVSIYPNPTTGNLNIRWSNQATGKADVVITDMTGREVFTSAVNMNAASGQTQINVNSLNDGVYLVTIKSDKIYYSGKLVKQQ